MVLFFVVTILFYADNNEFFSVINKQKSEGYKWHYVGKQPIEPKAKALSLRAVNNDGIPYGEPYVYWKLKK